MYRWKPIRFCVVCLSYAKFQAAENGYAMIMGRKVKITCGEPLCLDHDVRDTRGLAMTIATVEVAA